MRAAVYNPHDNKVYYPYNRRTAPVTAASTEAKVKAPVAVAAAAPAAAQRNAGWRIQILHQGSKIIGTVRRVHHGKRRGVRHFIECDDGNEGWLNLEEVKYEKLSESELPLQDNFIAETEEDDDIIGQRVFSCLYNSKNYYAGTISAVHRSPTELYYFVEYDIDVEKWHRHGDVTFGDLPAAVAPLSQEDKFMIDIRKNMNKATKATKQDEKRDKNGCHWRNRFVVFF